MSSINSFVFVGIFAISGAALCSCNSNKETGAAVSSSGETAGAAGSRNVVAAGGSQATGLGGTSGTSIGTSIGGSRANAGGIQTADAGKVSAGRTGGKAGGQSSAKGGTGGRGGSAGAAGISSKTGSLPAISDPALAGPYPFTQTDNTGPGENYVSIAPKDLGKGGIKHPILVWGPGAGAYPAIYQTLLNHIASHGFVVIAYNSTANGPELTAAMDWIITESKRDGSVYLNKVDTTKIAVGGQSAGSLGTFEMAGDPRLTTTLQINGGTFAPHTQVANLVKPALFICGDDPAVSGGDGTWVSDMARPNCDYDFENANAPVWYGVVIGSSHTTVIDNPANGTSVADNPLGKWYLAATAAWLRWQLAGDQEMKKLFVGPDCGYCKQPSVWLVQQKNLK